MQKPQQPGAVIAQLQNDLHQVRSQLLKLQQRVSSYDAESKLRNAGRKPTLPLVFQSQFGEDLLIWDAFAGQLDGFYIEVGAFDGEYLSVTYILEALGWKGLLIEPIPERYEQCVRKRPGSRVVHAALGPRSAKGTIDFTVVEDQYGGMFSFSKPTPQHMQTVNQHSSPRKKVTVPFTSMDELLKDHRGEIDVAVIDVEGVEIEVLTGFDLLRHKPKMVILEDNSLGQDPGLPGHMSTLPYSFIGWVGGNRVYVRADQADVIERAQRALR